MSSFLKQGCLIQLQRLALPLKQFQRYRGKINIQRPKAPHYERARVIAVTEPMFPAQPKENTCFQPNPRVKPVVENPYNDIIAREVMNWIKNSQMIAIFHLNSITTEDLFPVRVQLHKQNMHLKSYGKKIIEKAVQNTEYESIIPLFESQHCIVFSPEARVSQLMKITRRVPQMLLLAGIVENTLLSRNEFIAYGQLPGLQAAQAELVQTLNLAATNLVQQLETHQKSFINILDVYAKGTETEGGNGNETKSENVNETIATTTSEAAPVTNAEEEKK